jgi:hypothetical protein
MVRAGNCRNGNSWDHWLPNIYVLSAKEVMLAHNTQSRKQAWHGVTTHRRYVFKYSEHESMTRTLII